MRKVFSANRALGALSQLQSGEIRPGEALEVVAGVILENLELYNVVKNTQNAGQIVNMMRVELFPEDPHSKFIIRGLEKGTIPDFSEEDPEEYSIFRASAVFACSVKDSWASNVPHKGGEMLDNYIEESGYLPSDVREY